MPQESVLGPLLFLLYTSELFSILENKLIGYADDSTLMAVVPSPGIRVAVAESLIRDLGRVSQWCDLWGMKVNASNTKTMIVLRSCTMHPVDPWQSCVCFIRSGVTQCPLLMVLYLNRMCQRGLHAVHWSHIGILMHRLAA